MIGRRRLATLVPLLLALSACEMAPHYVAPETTPSPAFREAEGWGLAKPADDQPRGVWWRAFGDADLDGIEQQVLSGDQDIKAAMARFDQARALAGIARADLFPTLGLRAGETSGQLSHAVTNPLPNRRYDDDTVGVEASYELDLWGRVRDTARAARSQAQASAGDLATITLSLQAEAAADYFALRGFDAQAAVLDATVTAYDQALALTRARFKAGYAAQPDIAAAQAALELAKTRATDARLNRARLEHALAILTGQPPAVFSLPVRLIETQPPAIAEVLPGSLLERRPDVAAAERRVAAANAEIGAARAAFFPQISLNAFGGSEARTPSALFTAPASVWAAGAAGVLNLFDGGRRRASDARAHALLAEATARYRQAVLTAYGEVEDNLAATRLLAAEQATQAAAVEAASLSRLHAQRRYAAGYANYYEVITAQNIELSARLDLARIAFLRMNAGVLLIKALGGGWRREDLAIGASPQMDSKERAK